MELRSADQILIELCDYFDTLIAPRTLTRSNTNIIYLILKACAKGVEVINSVCYQVSLKFDPYNCSDEDLISTAKLVGTAPRSGTVSALEIHVTRTPESGSSTLQSGNYAWTNEGVTWTASVEWSSIPVPVPLEGSGEYAVMYAYSDRAGQFYIEDMEDVPFKYFGYAIPPQGWIYDVLDNSNRLGLPAESAVEFRKRLLTDTKRQRTLDALREEMLSLPYIFDVHLIFNETTEAVYIPGWEESSWYTLNPYCLLIFYSGIPPGEHSYFDNPLQTQLSEMLASYSLFPTQDAFGPGSAEYTLSYKSDVLVNKEFTYFMHSFGAINYGMAVYVKVNKEITSLGENLQAIRKAAIRAYNNMVHVDTLEANTIQNAVDSLTLLGINVIYCKLTVGESVHNSENLAYHDYLTVPDSFLPHYISEWGVIVSEVEDN